ncbi:inositol oxygenase family protein [Francisella frigiditurris]|uniref:Inositol oxygenase n=1 Tax=Francisella frigiditurris TaxID=1542390 RepID=A0A1J0KV68_9GAMM|nr:inositol oxygenase family protein [Francisella frigiditurris]APC97712.1 inositol oxygenase [Francisella frigiditurris]
MSNLENNSFGEFRNYTDSKFQDRVERTYREMHTNQSLDYVKRMKDKYFKLSLGKMDVYEVFKLLENVHDESDPDNDLPQIEHAYQTAEAVQNKFLENTTEIRDNALIKSLFRDHEWQSLPKKWKNFYTEKETLKELYSHIKDWSWFPLVGFIHDLGKIMTLPEYGALPQWSTVGDTYPVACPFASANVFFDKGFYKIASDYETYKNTNETHYGSYPNNCGFDAVEMSFGHDEYIYKVFEQGSDIPYEGLYLLRYHSFYPWHTPQTGGLAYQELANEKDWLLLPLLKAFQKADLYSKLPELPPKEVLEKKYKALLDKWVPKKKINW